jgi:hypothetical protein
MTSIQEMRRAVVVGLVVVGFAVLHGAPPDAMAAQQGRGSAGKKKYVATLDITVDKESGKLRKPTPAETEELVATRTTLTSRSTDGLKQTALSGGGTAVNLEGRFAPVMLWKPNPDGTNEVKCVTSFEEAADFLGLVEDVAR